MRSCSCCRSHDACYEESRKVPGCTGLDDLPYFINYNFTCSNRQVTCSGEGACGLKQLWVCYHNL